MHLRIISTFNFWLYRASLRHREIWPAHGSGYSLVNGSSTVHAKSFCKSPLHCETYIAPKLLMQPAGVTDSGKLTDFKKEIVCGLLEASYFNIMQQWQLSTFNHQALFFSSALEFHTIYGFEKMLFYIRPPSCWEYLPGLFWEPCL